MLNSKKTKDEGAWRQASLALMLPTLMVAGPLAGYLLGLGINRFFNVQPPWDGRIQIGMIILGMMAGFRETWHTIKKLSKESK